jgi:hypothetical protein
MTNVKRKHEEGAEGEASIEQVSQVLRESMVESPYQTLAAALGVGFFVGGGLWRPVAQALIGMGARFAIGQAISKTPRSDP